MHVAPAVILCYMFVSMMHVMGRGIKKFMDTENLKNSMLTDS